MNQRKRTQAEAPRLGVVHRAAHGCGSHWAGVHIIQRLVGKVQVLNHFRPDPDQVPDPAIRSDLLIDDLDRLGI